MQNLSLSKAIYSSFVFLALAITSSNVFAFDLEVTVSTQAVVFSTDNAAVESMTITVVSPEGEIVVSEVTSEANFAWVPADDSEDGLYRYQVTLSDLASGANSRNRADVIKPTVSKSTGIIVIDGGKFVVPVESEEVGATQRDTLFKDLVHFVLEQLVPSAHADIVQLDDVIIDGSACIGVDCAEGTSFGFDTLILRENNLRLLFDDSSNSASFPNNDWRLVANDSNNGGGNFFAIEDATAGRKVFVIDAGAPTNSLFVSSLGRLGIGTATPAVSIEAAFGDSPTLRLNQDGSGGWGTQVWDLAGNETNFFVRDVTNGSKLPFRIRPATPSNTLFLESGDQTGQVGINTNKPSEALHVVGNAIISGNLELGSSRSIKNDIRDLNTAEAMHAFNELKPVTFQYKHSPEAQSIGFIAEDVPDLVATEQRNSLRPMDIVAVLTKVVQDQQKTIEDLSQKLDSLLQQ